ncbi:MAG: hypothetical protein ACYDHP_04985 [Ferrimicrobium sp.]
MSQPTRNKAEDGFVDLIVLIGATTVLLWVFIPIAIGVARIITLKSRLEQSAYNLARTAVLDNQPPQATLVLNGLSRPILVETSGSLDGCSGYSVSLTTPTSLQLGLLPGSPGIVMNLTATATIATNAYLTPDSAGWDCTHA